MIKASFTHRTCHHEIYNLSCAMYELLVERAGNCCEICGIAASETSRGILSIDHDGRYGMAAVRGLLCDKCNSHMRFVDDGQRKRMAVESAYYANAWFTQADWYSAGGAPVVERHVDWRAWNAFRRATRGQMPSVLRQFFNWYCRVPGFPRPTRPAQAAPAASPTPEGATR